MTTKATDSLAEPVAAGAASVKLEDEKLPLTAGQATSVANANVLSFEDFNDLLEEHSGSTVGPVLNAYGHLLSLYHYTLSRLKLLELIGANGVLTDALILRLQLLNDENVDLLDTERSNRAKLEELESQLEDQTRQTKATENALHDAHQLLQQQEHELAGQANTLAATKAKYSSQSSRSRRMSDTSESHRSHRSSREDVSRHKDGGRARDHRSHRSESRKDGERERGHRPHERESSVTSSRRSSSRRKDTEQAGTHRDHSQVDRIYEAEDVQYHSSEVPLYEDKDSEAVVDSRPSEAERHISINGTAEKDTNTSSGSLTIASGSHPAQSKPTYQEEEDYEPEIDLGEDLLLEEEVPPLVKPIPSKASARTSRSRSPHRRRHGDSDSDNRHSHRTRSRSPRSADRRNSDTSVKKDNRDYEGDGGPPSTSTEKLDKPSTDRDRQERGEADRTRPRHREDSSSRTTKNRNNMYGRLGLPLSGGTSEGGRTQLSIRGAGRSSKK